MRYPLSVKPGENAMLLIGCPLLPEVTGDCEDSDEADLVGPARSAILAAFTGRIEDREAIPMPTDDPRLFVIFSALVALKIELHNAMVAAGVRKAELARRLGVHPPMVDRLLDLDHASKVEQMEAALSALGLEVKIATRAA